MPIKDLTGKKIEYFEVLHITNKRKRGCVVWLCKCKCGTIKELSSKDLLKTKSCGCFHLEAVQKIKKHGMSNTSTYTSYVHMKDRCLNKNNDSYKNYGGRGISVCDRWLDSFENFLEDMGLRPDGFTLDRVDVNGNYNKENCIWADRKTQSLHTRTRRTNKTGKSGVCKRKNRWIVTITVNYKTIYLGSFYDFGKAVECRENAEIKFYGTIKNTFKKIEGG